MIQLNILFLTIFILTTQATIDLIGTTTIDPRHELLTEIVGRYYLNINKNTSFLIY